MPITNAEKQSRFRKKEQLDKYVNQVSRDCQFTASNPRLRRSLGDLGNQLREAANLPSGWTDEDLARAVTRIRNIQTEILGTGDPLGNDLNDGRNFHEEFRRTPTPAKLMADFKAAERDTIALVSHLISSLELAKLPNEDRAAALMEAVRHVGRALGNSTSEGQSDAMAVCLASMNPHYERPSWFVDRLARWLRDRLSPDARRALGARLLEDDRGF